MNFAQHSRSIRLVCLIFCAAFFQLIPAEGQPEIIWDKTFGGSDWEELHSIRPFNNDNNIIIGGNTRSRIDGSVTQEMCGDTLNPKYDFWLMKTDIYGNKIWDKRYGGSDTDLMWTAIPTMDGGFLCGGFSLSNNSCDKQEDNIGGSGAADWWIVKTDSSGDPIWQRSYGTEGWEELRELVELPDGTFLGLGWGRSGLSGTFTADVAGNNGTADMRLAKFTAEGDILWDSTYGGTNEELGLKLLVTPQGDIIIGGQSSSERNTGNKTDTLHALQNNNDIWILKLEPNGKIIWDRTFGGENNDVLRDIEVLPSGDFLIAGQTKSGITGNKSSPNKGESDYWLIGIDKDGNKTLDQSYGGTELDDAYALYVNDDGEILIGGVSQSGNTGDKDDAPEGGNDFWVLFLEPDGEKIWDVSFGGTDHDSMFDIFPVSDGGVIWGGHSASNKSGDKSDDNFGKNDWWIIKTTCKLELDLGPDTTICEGTKVLLDATQLNCNDCRYRWSDNDREPIKEFGEPVTRTIDLHILSRSGCEIRDTITVNVNEAPKEVFAGITPPRCPGENTGAIQIVGVDGGTEPYYYSFNQGPYQSFPDFFNLGEGEYTLDILDINECKMDSIISLKEPPEINIVIDGGGTIDLGEQTTLIPLFSEQVDSFYWKAAPTLSCHDCLTPIASPLETTTYTITAFDEKRCQYIASTVVALNKERPIYFPTGFSPNNDGENDLYQFYVGAGVSKVSVFRIYDRWGELLYEVKDFIPGEYLSGWDGKQSNKDMPNGPYVYYCDVEFIDGWKEQIKGHFTLVR